MQKMTFFVDAPNIHNALREKPGFRKYKWLNYRKLAEKYAAKKGKVVGDVFYFMACRPWKKGSTSRHSDYEAALMAHEVDVEVRDYNKKKRKCPECSTIHTGSEDMWTDLGVVLKLFEEGINNTFDIAMIVTGDNDLASAIKAFSEGFPDKKIGVVLPVGARGRTTNRLLSECQIRIDMKKRDLIECQFPDVVNLLDGRKIHRPKAWS